MSTLILGVITILLGVIKLRKGHQLSGKRREQSFKYWPWVMAIGGLMVLAGILQLRG